MKIPLRQHTKIVFFFFQNDTWRSERIMAVWPTTARDPDASTAINTPGKYMIHPRTRVSSQGNAFKCQCANETFFFLRTQIEISFEFLKINGRHDWFLETEWAESSTNPWRIQLIHRKTKRNPPNSLIIVCSKRRLVTQVDEMKWKITDDFDSVLGAEERRTNPGFNTSGTPVSPLWQNTGRRWTLHQNICNGCEPEEFCRVPNQQLKLLSHKLLPHWTVCNVWLNVWKIS